MVAEQDRSFDAEVHEFKVNDGSSLRDITPYVTEIRGLPGQLKVNDLTTFGSAGERPGASIQVNHFTVEMLMNLVTSVGTFAVLELLYEGKVATAFEYYPAGNVTDNPKITGNALLVVFEVTGRVGDASRIHAEWHVDNGVSIGVVS